MGTVERGSIEISGLQGEIVIKEAGAVNGEAVSISDLENCEVYVLDYLYMLEVKNVKNCKIFIGPVDGAAIFESVENSQVAVAAQQIQIKTALDSQFELFSGSKPSIQNCAHVKIGCWRGQYPGLTNHFRQANLNPTRNLWDQVTNLTEAEGLLPAFELEYNVQPWTPPHTAEISDVADNPVPYNGGSNPFSEPFGEPASGGPLLDAADFSTGEDLNVANGHAEDMTQESSEHPKLTAINAKLRERQEAQETREREVKAELTQKAADYLKEFYQNRESRVQSRAKQNRDTEQGITIAGLEGKTEWEKAVNLVNFNFTRPNGTDLSRFKNVLFTAKSKNVPIKGASKIAFE